MEVSLNVEVTDNASGLEDMEDMNSLLMAQHTEDGTPLPERTITKFAMSCYDLTGRCISACTGYSARGEMYIGLLAANPEVRVRGAGKTVMHAAEKVARSRGCNRMSLTTYSWQARPFYEKIGFSVFGVKTNYPEGHEKSFLEKRWDPSLPMDETMFGTLTPNVVVYNSDQAGTEKILRGWLQTHSAALSKEVDLPTYEKQRFLVRMCDAADGAVVAGAIVETLWEEMRVNYLGTATCRGEVGEALHKQIIEKLEEVGIQKECNRMSCETNSREVRALYEGLDFRTFGEQLSHPVESMSLSYMEKYLW